MISFDFERNHVVAKKNPIYRLTSSICWIKEEKKRKGSDDLTDHTPRTSRIDFDLGRWKRTIVRIGGDRCLTLMRRRRRWRLIDRWTCFIPLRNLIELRFSYSSLSVKVAHSERNEQSSTKRTRWKRSFLTHFSPNPRHCGSSGYTLKANRWATGLGGLRHCYVVPPAKCWFIALPARWKIEVNYSATPLSLAELKNSSWFSKD